MLALVYLLVVPRTGRGTVTAFSVGYLSHLLADLPFSDILAGDLTYTTYLAWPLLAPPAYDEAGRTIIGYISAYQLGPQDLIEFLLFGVGLWIWYLDGYPGLDEFQQWLI